MVNVDVASKNGKNTMALMARDHKGYVLVLAAKRFPLASVELAKIKAIAWPMAEVEEMGWSQVTWKSDALNVVRQIEDGNDPGGWDFWSCIMFIKKKA